MFLTPNNCVCYMLGQQKIKEIDNMEIREIINQLESVKEDLESNTIKINYLLHELKVCEEIKDLEEKERNVYRERYEKLKNIIIELIC